MKSYTLTGDNPDLVRHVGHEVQISGRLITGGASGTATAGPTGTTSAPASTTTASTTTSSPAAGGTNAAGTQQIEVQTVRLIASTCAAR